MVSALPFFTLGLVGSDWCVSLTSTQEVRRSDRHQFQACASMSFSKFSFLKPKAKDKFNFLKPFANVAHNDVHLSDLQSIIRFKQVARRAAVGAAIGAVIEDDEPGGKQGPQGPKREDVPFVWEYHSSRLTEQEFQLRYRLSKAAFDELLDLLRDDLVQRSIKNAKNSKSML